MNRLGEIGERFDEAMQGAVPTEVPFIRPLPQEREIRRENGSVTVTNHYHVVVNYGREEDNKRIYPDSCGCNRGCAPGKAAGAILSGSAAPRTAGETVLVALCIAASAYAVWRAVHTITSII